jgi:lysophospholipase L1-like esterase
LAARRSVPRLLGAGLLAAALMALSGALVLAGLELRGREIDLRLARAIETAPSGLAPARPPAWGDARPRVLVAGDSRVAGWAPRPDIAPARLVFSGIGGETSAELRRRLERDLRVLAPDRLVVAAGVNDLIAASLSPARAGAVMAGLETNLRAIAGQARAAGIEVTLLTVPRPARPGPVRRVLLWSDDLPGLVEAANARIRAMEGPGIAVLDADAALAGPPGAPLPADLAADAVHFTPEAYTRLNALLAETFGG